MTGLRQGELVALRWLDVDWTARRVRVRRNYTRRAYGTPKAKGSHRSVPLADRLGGELDRLYGIRFSAVPVKVRALGTFPVRATAVVS
jgi:integrase